MRFDMRLNGGKLLGFVLGLRSEQQQPELTALSANPPSASAAPSSAMKNTNALPIGAPSSCTVKTPGEVAEWVYSSAAVSPVLAAFLTIFSHSPFAPSSVGAVQIDKRTLRLSARDFPSQPSSSASLLIRHHQQQQQHHGGKTSGGGENSSSSVGNASNSSTVWLTAKDLARSSSMVLPLRNLRPLSWYWVLFFPCCLLLYLRFPPVRCNVLCFFCKASVL